MSRTFCMNYVLGKCTLWAILQLRYPNYFYVQIPKFLMMDFTLVLGALLNQSVIYVFWPFLWKYEWCSNASSLHRLCLAIFSSEYQFYWLICSKSRTHNGTGLDAEIGHWELNFLGDLFAQRFSQSSRWGSSDSPFKACRYEGVNSSFSCCFLSIKSVVLSVVFLQAAIPGSKWDGNITADHGDSEPRLNFFRNAWFICSTVGHICKLDLTSRGGFRLRWLISFFV